MSPGEQSEIDERMNEDHPLFLNIPIEQKKKNNRKTKQEASAIKNQATEKLQKRIMCDEFVCDARHDFEYRL